MTETATDHTSVAILGASGYTGAELVRLLARHPAVRISVLTAERHAGQPMSHVFPHLAGLGLPDLMRIEDVEWAGLDVDVIFCALPHGAGQEVVAGILHATGHTLVDELMREDRGDLVSGLKSGVAVIDLSADFRLTDPELYDQWYGAPHRVPSLLARSVYGLTEVFREEIRDAKLVACPGCYPTASLLPLLPLVKAGVIEVEDLIIDAKSGVTGAGRAPVQGTLYSEVAEGIHAYGVGAHRHTPEIEQALGEAAGNPVRVNFTPHLTPMSRGILATIYIRLAGAATPEDAHAALAGFYEGSAFVRVLKFGELPSTRHVTGSNHCLIGVVADRISGRVVVVSALDNLVKGASGQAIQNMNLIRALPETLGLEQLPMFP